MQRLSNSSLFFCSFLLLCSCSTPTSSESKKVVVTNEMNKDRSFETVTVSIDALDLAIPKEASSLVIEDIATKKKVVSQTVDTDGDGIEDILIFQPTIQANSEKSFTVGWINNQNEVDTLPACYSRFVPERTDDYAWENNLVAFRTYGPTAQRMIEEGIKGGTLSSGIDAWLKRVEYPIIDKWYEKHTSGTGSYHEDTGEGLDNFHVGISRGVGGTAINVDSSYFFSKNFISWKTLCNGPLRTSFILTYGDWDANGNLVSEEKHISLDYGSYLSKFEIHIKGIDTISTGLTLHNKEGEIGINPEEGWVCYWEPHEGSELGTGVVVPDDNFAGYERFISGQKDESNLYAHVKVNNSTAVYYAGFGWKETGKFNSLEDWENYLSVFSQQLNNPLKVEIR